MNLLTCSSCRRPLTDAEVRRVPDFVGWVAAFAFAFMHGGLWAREELRGPYCARCRAKIVPATLIIAALIFGAVAFGARLWLKGP